MKQIKLTQGKFAIVDDSDFEWLNQWKWCFHIGYVVRNKREKGKCKMIYMHRLINNTSSGFETDHINRNKLDNRRSNLRTVTSSQNNMNTGMWKHNTSKHKGVFWDKSRNKWMAGIGLNYKFINVGRFNDIGDAIKAREQAERTYFSV